MKKMLKRLCTGFLALATVVTALPTTPVHAESKQYWTESAERVGIIEKVMNDGSIGSTFNEGYMKVEGETAYCIDINTNFKNGYKTRADASSRMSADQISDVALSLEYVKQYGEAHKELNYKQVYLLEQCVVWQRLSVHFGWQCDNVRASYDEIPKATQDEVFSGAKAFIKENKGRYECGGYIYSGEGQELGQFWAKLNVGNAKLQKTSSNTSITDGNGNYSIAGATGENHVVVTDDNGQFSTSADWASHKHNTNAGKTSEDGVWFGTSEPDDSKGALPYDTYIIEEMRCDSNKGFELIPPFEIVVSRNNLVIDLGTLTDEYEKEISIHTTATSKDGEKTILAGKEVTIVDTVKLDGLTKGTKYQLKGWQMLKEENAELIIDGKRVENDYTFVADDEEMKVEISYTFNASALGGKNLVTFEELYDFSNSDEPVKVAEHKDIEDDGQTVLITERIIKIHTTATDKDGNKELKAGKDVTIIDTVTLEGLEVGTQYKLVGWQMLKEENAELLINGKRVESDYTFIADSEAMKVEVAFTFDATSLDGKQLVTFEELYDLSNPDEPKKVTEHKDIEDKGQTITFKEKPEEPEKPETPPTPEKPNRPSDSPKTGDSTNVMAFLVMLLASAGGLAGTYLYKRRKMKKS